MQSRCTSRERNTIGLFFIFIYGLADASCGGEAAAFCSGAEGLFGRLRGLGDLWVFVGSLASGGLLLGFGLLAMGRGCFR